MKNEARFKVVAEIHDEIVLSEFFSEPTAHEVWVRDRIPRGEHYDPTADGPETDREWRSWMINILWLVEIASITETWLDSHSHQFDFGGFDLPTLLHRRE